MIRKIIISLCLTVLSCVVCSAVPYRAVLDSLDVVADSVSVDSLDVNDSTDAKNTGKEVRDRGFDVSSLLNGTRYKAPAHTEFNKNSFFSNTFIGVRASTIKVMTPDYGFGPTAGGVIGKWVHPAVAVRLGAGLGYWYDNFDARKIRAIDLSADVMFNMMSYVGGYNTARFCEMSVVGGLGYTHVWKKLADHGDALSAHVGLNFDMRIYDRLHLFVEPQVNLFFNPRHGSPRKGIAISSAGDWRSYMPAFNTFVGLAYNFGQTKPQVQRLSGSWKNPKLDWNGYYVSALAGLQFQSNSRLVWKGNMSAGERVGMHYSLGGGRWFNEFLAVRVSASYSQNNWVKYLSAKPLRSRYMSVRLEGVLDVLNMGRHLYGKSIGVENPEDCFFGLAILAGPEMGHMVKHDKTSKVHDHYVGLVGGLQARFRVHKWVSVIAEPRFTVVPYTAPNSDVDAPNDNRNYYDALLNFNVGIEVRIPARHK
jgi:hypothetical protein